MGFRHRNSLPLLSIKCMVITIVSFVIITGMVESSHYHEHNYETAHEGSGSLYTTDFNKKSLPLPGPLSQATGLMSLNTSPVAISKKQLSDIFDVQANDVCTCTCTCNLDNVCPKPSNQPTSMPTATMTAPPLGGTLDTSLQPTSSLISQPTSMPTCQTPMPTCPPTTPPPFGGTLDTSFQPTSSPTSLPTSSPTSQPTSMPTLKTAPMPTCPACFLDNSSSHPLNTSIEQTSNLTIVNPFSIGVVASKTPGPQ